MSNKNTTQAPQKTQKNHQAKRAVPPTRHRRLLKWLLGISACIVVLVAAAFISFQVSPWPGSLLIRYEFNKGGAKLADQMEKYVPSGVASISDQQYRPNDGDAYLDVFYPESAGDKALPTVVWVHGGAWVSGDKDDIDNYLKILAGRGFTAIGVNYSIAPEKKYPTPLFQLNDALGYIKDNAGRLHVNPDQIVLAGDSAGSQIVAQMGAIITSPVYAHEIGIDPKLGKESLQAMVLNCGAYDLNLPDYNGAAGDFLHTVLWAYSGTKNFLQDPKLRHASVVNYVTADFPPTFLTAGNDDPLEAQSTEMAQKLSSLGVPTSTLFYPKNHEPKLGHEYQFELDLADAQKALQQIVTFLHEHTE